MRGAGGRGEGWRREERGCERREGFGEEMEGRELAYVWPLIGMKKVQAPGSTVCFSVWLGRG